MKKLTTPTSIILISLLFVLQSCSKKPKKSVEKIKDNTKTVIIESNPISSEFKSLIRPGKKVKLGITYTDTIKYVEYNDEGDYIISAVEKDKNLIYLIDKPRDSRFIRGDVLEIRWKMDSIRYAGDDSYINFREFLIAAKKIKLLKLKDKSIKFLWRANVFDKDAGTEINTMLLNNEYIKNISEPEKAAVAYIATFVGNECEWDGNVNDSRSNLKCKILSALGLGYQCSDSHLSFLRKWFRNDKNILKEIERCPTTPNSATIQDTFDEINIEVKENQINIFFAAHVINVRESTVRYWTEKYSFEFNKNELVLIKKEVSPKQQEYPTDKNISFAKIDSVSIKTGEK